MKCLVEILVSFYAFAHDVEESWVLTCDMHDAPAGFEAYGMNVLKSNFLMPLKLILLVGTRRSLN
jgi:hypothetical protein